MHSPVADPEGVPWVPWNPSFEEAAFENTMHTTLTQERHTSGSTVAITHVCQLLYQEFDARMAYVHVYYQKHVATIETMNEASKRIKAYSCIAPSAARDGDMLSG